MKQFAKVSAAMALVLAVSGTVRATVISTISADIPLANLSNTTNADAVNAWKAANGDQAPVDVGLDLLTNHVQAGSPTYSGGMMYDSHLPNINDGLLVSSVRSGAYNYAGGYYYPSPDFTAGFTDNSSAFSHAGDLIFQLDGPHDISRIDSFTIYVPLELGQNYSVATSTDGGVNWNPLISVDYPWTGVGDNNWYLRRVSIVDDQGGMLATGVNALKFTINESPHGWSDVYGEIAAYGVTSVPDPSAASAGMAILGGLVLSRGFRRRVPVA